MLPIGACALVAAIGMTSCDRNEESPATTGTSALDQTKDLANDVATKTSEVWQNAKSGLVSTGNEQLSKVESSIETLKSKGSQVSAESKAAYDTAMSDLSRQLESVKSEFAKLKDASQDSWEKVSADFQKSLADLKESTEKAMSKFGTGA